MLQHWRKSTRMSRLCLLDRFRGENTDGVNTLNLSFSTPSTTFSWKPGMKEIYFSKYFVRSFDQNLVSTMKRPG